MFCSWIRESLENGAVRASPPASGPEAVVPLLIQWGHWWQQGWLDPALWSHTETKASVLDTLLPGCPQSRAVPSHCSMSASRGPPRVMGTEMEPPPSSDAAVVAPNDPRGRQGTSSQRQSPRPVAPRRPPDGALLSLAGVAISTYAKYCYNKLQKAALTGAKKVPPGPADVFLPAGAAPWWGRGQAAPGTGQDGAHGSPKFRWERRGTGTSL